MYTRIVSNPAVLGGKPLIKGTRISVEFLLEIFASGATRHEILDAYPHLTPEDIEESLRYAAEALKHDRYIHNILKLVGKGDRQINEVSMSAKKYAFSIVLLQEGEWWSAQCLEYDIATQAKSFTEGRRPFEGIGPAPQRSRPRYTRSSTFRGVLPPC